MFLLFGIMVEWLQSQTSYRSGDLWDLVANTLGVFSGWLAARTPAAALVAHLDARLARLESNRHNS